MAPTVAPEVAYDVQNIHTALAPAVADQEALVNIIGRREYQQLLVIARQYRISYGIDLATELDRRIIGSLGSLLAGAVRHKVLAEVQYLNRAGKSNRKYETLRKKDTAVQVFSEILIGRSPEDLKELHAAYEAVYESKLDEHLFTFCENDAPTKAFFTNILKARQELPIEDLGAAVEHLHRLLASQDLLGLLEHISNLTTAQLGNIVRNYNNTYREAHVVTTINKTIAHKHKGVHLDLVLYAVMHAADRARHVALLLEESMEGLGTNEDQLSRLVVSYRGKFMDKVKAAYQVDYGRTLADRIRGDTSGLYSHLICHLINQTI